MPGDTFACACDLPGESVERVLLFLSQTQAYISQGQYPSTVSEGPFCWADYSVRDSVSECIAVVTLHRIRFVNITICDWVSRALN